MSYTLNKPYTDIQRADFIVEYNHRQGLKIEETSQAIYALEAWELLDGDTVIDNTEVYKTEQAQERQSEFEQQFFLTSLGYIRRSVNMATGETKDFICDIVPALQAGLAQGIATPIITYELPDFTKELTTEYLESLQEVKSVTAEFLQECIMQLANDFMPQGLNVGVNDEGVNEGEEAKTPADTETVKKDDQESEEETTI